ncbi:MAG: hypothetical protein IPM38_17325 [Ignavibacteria bacterium]|nr:hypothetical protein [Ignavibacteria bacterium]
MVYKYSFFCIYTGGRDQRTDLRQTGYTTELNLFYEGFYNEVNNLQEVDLINVQLRNSVSPYAIEYQNTDLLQSNGSAPVKFVNISSGNYYIAVTHRNSLETWSAVSLSFTSGTTEAYNFSTASSQAFGGNLIQVDAAPVRFAAFSGDVDQDGTIDIADGSLIDNDAFNFTTGYLPTDINGDSITDVADAVFADNNGYNFVGKITP